MAFSPGHVYLTQACPIPFSASTRDHGRGIDHQWQADLVDLGRLSKFNKGVKFLLTCIDVLSKYAWVVPLQNKTGQSLVTAFLKIFETGRRPLALQTDKGTEFKNKVFQKFLRDHGITFFTTENDIKASIME